MENRKYLPIKIVEKRKELDDSLTEGSGGDIPNWMYNVPLEERVEKISHTLHEAGNELDRRINNDIFIPVALELKLDDKTIAKSYRSAIRKIIDVNHKNNLIGYFDDASLLVKIDNKEDLNLIETKLQDLERNIQGLASIIETNLFQPHMEIEDNSILKVKLIDFKDTELNRTVHRAFQSRCRENNIPIEVTHYSNDLIIYKIPYSEKAMPVLQSFEGLNSIEDMPTYSITFGLEPEIKTKFEGIKEPSKDENYPTVGVLDSEKD